MHLPIVNTLLSFFLSIQDLVGKKVYLFLIVSVVLGILEGIGLALLVPLFFVFQEREGVSSSEWLLYIKKFFFFLHIHYTNERFLILVVCLFLFSRVFSLISYQIEASLLAKSQSMIYHKVFKNFINIHYAYFNRFDLGYFNNLLQNETVRSIAAIQYYTKAINNLILTIVLFIIALKSSFFFSITVVACSGFTMLLLNRLTTKTKKVSYQLSLENSFFQTNSISLLNNYKYLSSTNSFSNFMPYLEKCADHVVKSKYRMKILTDRLSVFTMMLIFPLLVGVIYLFIKIFGYSVESIMISLVVCQRALSKALSFQSLWQSFNNAFGSFKFFTKSLAEAKNFYVKNNGLILDASEISIKLKDVEFSYNNDFKIQIDWLDFPANCIISLVGRSGSGKTTVLDIICGLYDLQKGKIFVNDFDFSELNIRSFRANIGFVNQENSLFNDTIFNNVSLWAELNAENIFKVKEACKLANIDSFVEGLEKKYETIIGDKGLKISGGQRQRLAIARELYKKPKLLLLDEATSALDSESEQKIKDTIDTLKGKMTIIIVAHRLSTIRNSDKIVVFDYGKIVQVGTFTNLSQEDGRFKELVNNQLIKE